MSCYRKVRYNYTTDDERSEFDVEEEEDDYGYDEPGVARDFRGEGNTDKHDPDYEYDDTYESEGFGEY